jgi:membrane-bound lytic murein transglycosylase D
MERGLYLTLRQCIGAACSLAVLFSPAAPDARAAFDQTGVVADPLTALDTSRVFKTEFTIPDKILESPAISDAELAKVLGDKESRVSADFKVPEGIEPLVRFWLGIYTQYTTHHLVIFDSKEPQIVYDVLDLRPLYKSARNMVAYEIVARYRARQAMARVRSQLAYLARHPKLKNPNPDQAKILKAIQDSGTRVPIAQLAHQVRSQTGQRDNVMRGLVAAEPFFVKMETIFKEMGIPLELTRLPLVESSFNIRAYSRVGAAGVWQFMPASAREYMKISNGFDERLSPLKATVAAGRLLERNFKMLGNWTLAVIAYNHGYRGLPHLRGEQAADFSRIAYLFNSCRGACAGKRRSPLRFASKNYYAEFLAMVHAEAYRDVFYGTPPRLDSRSIAFQRLARPLSGLGVSAEHGVAVRDFMVFNPDVRDMRKTLPKGYWVALPSSDDRVTILASLRRDVHEPAQVSDADNGDQELIRAYDVHNPRLRNH